MKESRLFAHTNRKCAEGRDRVLRRKGKAGSLLVLWAALLAVFGAVLTQPDRAVDAMAAVDAPCVALTFDDGPRRETTELLLDGLARRGIHATFFVVGTRIEGQEDILLRMEAEGHQIGIHSQNHKVLAELGERELHEEVDVLAQTLDGLLGTHSYMLRPPYGMTSGYLLKRIKCPVILWSVDPEDWSDHNVERQVAAVVDKAKDGDIILLHDIYYASVETALQAADALMEQGYRFVTVEELFAIRGITPKAGCEYRSLPHK